jgi:hypothetical protein
VAARRRLYSRRRPRELNNASPILRRTGRVLLPRQADIEELLAYNAVRPDAHEQTAHPAGPHGRGGTMGDCRQNLKKPTALAGRTATSPREARQTSGATHDSVRMYLREIGKVPLLTAARG